MKDIKKILASLLFLIIFCIFLLAGGTPKQAADTLVNDVKFGRRALLFATLYGDLMIEPLKEASDNFSRLNDRNSIWINEYFISNDSKESNILLHNLLFNNNYYAKLIGVIGLASHGKNEEVERMRFFVEKIARRELSDLFPDNSKWFFSSINELSYMALGKLGGQESVSILRELLFDMKTAPNAKWRQAAICNAIREADFIDTNTINTLRNAIIDHDFHSSSQCFSALLAYGDVSSIQLAITRLSIVDTESSDSKSIIKELSNCTNKRFGANYKKWEDWWNAEKDIFSQCN